VAKKRKFASLTEAEEFFKATGSQGGKKRMSALTKEQRLALAKKAAAARWGKKGREK
jgi:hypothetical protein